MNILDLIARRLKDWGVSANAMTLAGLCVNAGAGVLAAGGWWWWAAVVMALGGFCDLLDGRIARMHAARSKFGALLDSSLDRYGDFFLIGGIGYWYSLQGYPIVLIAALSALMGSFEISYVRARAEGLGFECRVGFWERGERWVLLMFGLLVGNPAGAVLLLAFATHGTAIHRLLHIRAKAEGTAKPTSSQNKWSNQFNWLIAALSLAFAALFRWPV